MDLEEGKSINLQEAQNTGYKISVIITIFDHIESLTEHADIGRIVSEFNEDYIREQIHPPFRIVYLRGSDNTNN